MTLLGATSALYEDIIESGSFLRVQTSACDYGVLDNAPACAVVLRPGLSTMDYIGFGGVSEDTWNINVQGWVQDTGDPVTTLTNVIHIHDALKSAINGGSNANNYQYTTRCVSISHNPDQIWNFGSYDYFLVTATANVREDP